MNKRLFLSIALFLSVTIGLSAQNVKFDSLEINYGLIWSGADGICEVSFTNTGNAPLVIYHAITSDGGSYATPPREPIMPGAQGNIKIKYDTNRIGRFTRTLRVASNATEEPEMRLRFYGEVRKFPPAYSDYKKED